MISFNDNNVKRELIMKHYSKPNNKGDITGFDIKVDQYSTKCVDKLHLGLKIENNVIVDAKFQAEGCAVFLASVDIMIDQIKNKDLDSAKEIVEDYEKMINRKIDSSEKINELNIFNNVATHINRLHCAEMISEALKKIIQP